MEDKQTFTFEPTAVGRYLSVRKLYPEKSSSLTLCEVAVTAHVYVKAGQQQTKQTRDIEPLLFQWLSSVVDDGPPLKQQGLNVSCLLGRDVLETD